MIDLVYELKFVFLSCPPATRNLLSESSLTYLLQLKKRKRKGINLVSTCLDHLKPD